MTLTNETRPGRIPSRAIFVTQKGKRIVVVWVFQKKTRKTPNREIKLAQERAKELE
ncbi:MAG: type II toxin-antitoxin system RelE/ParE family toxin [Alphaproteobacteria bacterium]